MRSVSVLKSAIVCYKLSSESKGYRSIGKLKNVIKCYELASEKQRSVGG